MDKDTAEKLPNGTRVLVAEDEPLLALDMAELLRSVGAEVVGPATTVKQALELLFHTQVHCAVLDVNLRDGDIFPAAKLLKDSRAGIIFYSGQSRVEDLKRDWPSAYILPKPSPLKLLVPAIIEACTKACLSQ